MRLMRNSMHGRCWWQLPRLVKLPLLLPLSRAVLRMPSVFVSTPQLLLLPQLRVLLRTTRLLLPPLRAPLQLCVKGPPCAPLPKLQLRPQ
jgi:hypothetical protein